MLKYSVQITIFYGYRMLDIKKRKNIKVESKAIDKELEKLKEELFADIVSVESVESIKTSRKRREPKYSMVVEAIKLVAKMSRNAYRLNLEKVFQLENYSKLYRKRRVHWLEGSIQYLIDI